MLIGEARGACVEDEGRRGIDVLREPAIGLLIRSVVRSVTPKYAPILAREPVA